MLALGATGRAAWRSWPLEASPRLRAALRAFQAEKESTAEAISSKWAEQVPGGEDAGPAGRERCAERRKNTGDDIRLD